MKGGCTSATLKKALLCAVFRQQQKAKREPGDGPGPARTVGFLGAKGGVGTTTLACNFASTLRQETAQPVLLADFDLHSGLVAFLTGLEPQYSIADALQMMERLDRTCWEALVAKCPDGLEVITSPGLNESRELEAKLLPELLLLVKPF